MPPDTRDRRRFRLGLRPRLVLALVLTSAVTLGTAALALFSPLQNQLRDQSESSLRASVLTARPGFEEALRQMRDGDVSEIAVLASRLGQRTSSRILVTDDLYPYNRVTRTLDGPAAAIWDTAAAGTPDDPLDIIRALTSRRTQVTSGPDGTRMAALLRVRRGKRTETYVLAARSERDDAGEIVARVRSAFGQAALVGLVAALLVGAAVVTTLLRRLERLRGAAMRMAQEGVDAPPPHDTGADEVGDLARTLGQMQRALRRQEQARRTFVATASHELRTPLTSLGGMLELLEDDLLDGRVDLEDAQRQIILAQREVGRLTHLASDLLDLSRLDAGTELRTEPVELLEVVRAVAAEFDARAAGNAIRVEVRPPRGPCWASADPSAVARIVRILLDNALRFAPEGSVITVSPGFSGERTKIDVTDRGPGVPPVERERIFQRFERGSRTGGEGGFGLGLAIGRELARRHGGNLALYDGDGDRPGATFRLTLPIADS